jgi:hypothetical protein
MRSFAQAFLFVVVQFLDPVVEAAEYKPLFRTVKT